MLPRGPSRLLKTVFRRCAAERAVSVIDQYAFRRNSFPSPGCPPLQDIATQVIFLSTYRWRCFCIHLVT